MTRDATPPLFVFVLLPEHSAYNASFTLAQRLVARGYQVLYGGPESFREHVVAQGFNYQLVNMKPIDDKDSEPPSGFLERWIKTRQTIQHYRKESRLLMERCVEDMRRLNPTLVLLDPIIWQYAELPLRCGVPVVALSHTFASFCSSIIPPVFYPIEPGDPSDWRIRLRNILAWVRHITRMHWSFFLYGLLGSLRYGLLPNTDPATRIRQLGVRLRWSEYGLRPVIPELVVAPRELDLPQLAASNKRAYAGACVQISRDDGEFDWKIVDPKKKLIYCSLGTYSQFYPHAKRLFSAVIETLKLRPDLQGLIQIGTAVKEDELDDVPDNVRLIKFAPQIEILKRAAIFITHGGISSVREALYFGVPMIVFPCNVDQPGNAIRILYHNLGVRGDISNVDQKKLISMISQIESGRFDASLEHMKLVLQQQDTCQTGVEFIEKITGCSPRTTADPHELSMT